MKVTEAMGFMGEEKESAKRFSAPNFKNTLHMQDARFVYGRYLINSQWMPSLELIWWGKHRLKLQKALKATWMGYVGADGMLLPTWIFEKYHLEWTVKSQTETERRPVGNCVSLSGRGYKDWG